MPARLRAGAAGTAGPRAAIVTVRAATATARDRTRTGVTEVLPVRGDSTVLTDREAAVRRMRGAIVTAQAVREDPAVLTAPAAEESHRAA